MTPSRNDRSSTFTCTAKRALALTFVATALLVAAACGGKVDGPAVAGPDTGSHWLSTCSSDAECGSELSCLCNQCTSACERDADCSDAGPGATCEAATGCGEPRVCVVQCEDADDCAVGATCRDERCEAESPTSNAASSSNGGTSSSNGSGAAGTSSPSGGEPPCSDALECPSTPGAQAISECPATVDAPATEPLRAHYEGDALVLQVRHESCADDRYELCYEPTFAESSPVQASLRLVRSNGADCGDVVDEELRFDMTPLADYYRNAYQATGGSIVTGPAFGGLYAFGELSCEARVDAAVAQTDHLRAYASRGCETAADCTWHDYRTACDTWTCGVPIATSRQDYYSSVGAAIDSAFCAAHAVGECPHTGPLVDCAQPGPENLACEDGVCVGVFD